MRTPRSYLSVTHASAFDEGLSGLGGMNDRTPSLISREGPGRIHHVPSEELCHRQDINNRVFIKVQFAEFAMNFHGAAKVTAREKTDSCRPRSRPWKRGSGTRAEIKLQRCVARIIKSLPKAKGASSERHLLKCEEFLRKNRSRHGYRIHVILARGRLQRGEA